jgi:hypothetical protein
MPAGWRIWTNAVQAVWQQRRSTPAGKPSLQSLSILPSSKMARKDRREEDFQSGRRDTYDPDLAQPMALSGHRFDRADSPLKP